MSPNPWSSLNFGNKVGDAPERVKANHRRAFQALNRNPETVVDVSQVHGDTILCVDRFPPPSGKPEADAIISPVPQITLLMRFADCMPILLYDHRQRVVGLVHAGWKGTVKKLPLKAVRRMISQYGCRPEDIRAAIGPGIAAHHYQVGEEVVSAAEQAFPDNAGDLLISDHGKIQFDLCAANAVSLNEAGVEMIEFAHICTACHLEDWYSHRAEHGQTGRFAAMIGIA